MRRNNRRNILRLMTTNHGNGDAGQGTASNSWGTCHGRRSERSDSRLAIAQVNLKTNSYHRQRTLGH
eukprot:5121388-Amphidinium_carterae.2